ncbi:zinc-binding dehydrogenase domain-containing protein [Trichoderma breve]|uniref:Zinc-binding dehydrogenase domain-containing protein n=1 Tax=Trichoderma breve TaxID=2034170 RepID=A0A9W9BMN0_9HYPO|nr:zinc-binding dehydrogenase domain-containing protein [Trichoderma breve]KAJ4862661.1 zinc-binding dehydrogenase domain-containing protein [Trichoderma breve]
MRAWTFSSGGMPEKVLSFNPSLPAPAAPKGSDVLIKISHASLSSPGTNLMRDIPSLLRKNAIPELDFSGRVVSAGPDVPAEFAPGAAVFGTVSKSGSIIHNQGTLAEYIVLNVNCIAPKPTNITFAEAACLSCLGQVALEMVRQAKIKTGDRVLVNGGSGAVGSAAIQLCKDLGAFVVTTCSTKNAYRMKQSLGVDEIIDYALVKSIPAALEKSYSASQFDAILDTVGSRELFLRCPKYLKPEGVFINVGDGSEGRLSLILHTLQNVLQPSILGGVPRRYMTFSAPLNGQNAAYLGNLASNGKIMVFIDSTFPLEDAISGYNRYQSGQAQGRVVIDIANMDTQDQ